MFIKLVDKKVIKFGDIKRGDIVPLIDIDNESVFMVNFINEIDYKKIKEYAIDSAIGRIFWNMKNLGDLGITLPISMGSSSHY